MNCIALPTAYGSLSWRRLRVGYWDGAGSDLEQEPNGRECSYEKPGRASPALWR